MTFRWTCILILWAVVPGCTLDSAGTGAEQNAVSTGGVGGASEGGQGGGSGSGGSGGQAGLGGVGGQGGVGGAPAGGSGAQPPLAECGNNVVEDWEQCDDGNAAANDGCSDACQVECPDGASVGPNLHCYWYLPDPQTWPAAKATCESQNGHLATLTSVEENGFLGSVVQEVVWIGATDGKGEGEAGAGTYGWVTGEPLSYKAWGVGEPNAASDWCDFFTRCFEHCATLRPDGFWNDTYCEQEQLPAVCERTPPGLAQ